MQLTSSHIEPCLPQTWDWQPFSEKVQRVNILGFVGPVFVGHMFFFDFFYNLLKMKKKKPNLN